MAWRRVEPGIYRQVDPTTGKEWPALYVKVSIRGRPRFLSAKTQHLKAARLRRADQELKAGRGEPVISGKLTVGKLCDQLQAHYELDDRWTRDKRRALLLIRVALGRVHPADLVTEHHDLIEDMQASWKRTGMSNPTINRYCNYLRRALRFAVTKGRLGSVPIVTRRDESKSKRGRYMPPEHAARIAAELAPWVRVPFLVAYAIGKRQAELYRTLRTDVDLRPGHEVITWQPKEGKTRQPHVIPLVGEALELVQEAIATPRLGCPYLFHGRRCRPGRATPEARLGCVGDTKKALEGACRRAGLPYGRQQDGYTFHSTRHAAATNLRAVLDEADVIKITGHKTTAVFRHHYDHVAAEALRPKLRRAAADGRETVERARVVSVLADRKSRK
jgi:integrase